jgi:spermidine synthase
LLFGKIADKLSQPKLLKTYSLLELGIGASAVLTLFLIPQIKYVYAIFSDGTSQSLPLVFVKFFLAIAVLLAPTILMGATLPVLTKVATTFNKSLEHSVSWLYAANTFGAVVGVIAAGYVLIEIFGLRNTLLTAALINFLLSLAARFLKIREITPAGVKISNFGQVLNKKAKIVILSFSISGLISIAYEVLWTRILTATLGTFTYAFALMLAVYLLGIALGSFGYQMFTRPIKSKYLAFAVCELLIGVFALSSVYITSNQVYLAPRALMISVLFPASVFMGLTFPVIVSILSDKNHSGKIVGVSYFANTIGSIIGGFIASFVLLRYVGSTQSIILLSLVNFLIALFFIKEEFEIKFLLKFTSIGSVIILIIFTAWLFAFKRNSLYEKTTQWRLNWAKENSINFALKEDEVASVFGYHNVKNNDYNLFIDGVPTTGKVGETKLMAHIPILLHPDPHDTLVIAFGMGTSFRSSVASGYRTDVVELVPSVPELMYLFHDDATKIKENPNAKIIINDGRNYIFLTKKMYDIVVIDPPPPFNASGTTVLYSKEFYEEIAEKLNEGGIVSQWIYFGSREDDIAMAIKSFIEVFPNVLAFQPVGGAGGLFLQGSFSPFDISREGLTQKLKNESATKDLSESYKDLQLKDVLNLVIGDRESLLRVVGEYDAITDDRPRTEYFKLRHKFTDSPDLADSQWGKSFIDKLKSQKLHLLKE